MIIFIFAYMMLLITILKFTNILRESRKLQLE